MPIGIVRNFMKKSRIIFILIILMIMLVIPSSFAIDYTSNDDLNLANEELALDSVTEDGIAVNENIEDSVLDENSDSSSNLGVDHGQIKTNISDSTYNDLQSAINGGTGEFSIFIGEGTYTNAKSGSNDLSSGEANTNLSISNKKINFIGAGKDKTFIDGTNTDWLLNISDSDVTFKDLSFINGFSNSSSVFKICCSNVTFNNCEIANNTFYSTGTIYSLMSFEGYYTVKDYTLNITDTSFLKNNVLPRNSSNGVILSVARAKANIENTIFVNNPYSAGDPNFSGGAIYIYGTEILTTINNCIFINCSDNNGGSIRSYYGGNLTILNSKFINSTAGTHGAAIYCLDYSSYYLTLHNNEFENCKLADGTEENIYYEGVKLVELGTNATISVNSTEAIAGEDNLLGFAVYDNESNPLTTQLEITLTSSKNSFTETVSVEGGMGNINLKDLPTGVYTLVATLKDDNYIASIAKATVKIRGDYDYTIIFNPSTATLYEGQEYNVSGTVIDCYGEATLDLNGVKVSCQWETTGGSVHSRTSLGFINGSSFSYDISDLELVPTKVYDIIFILNYEHDGITVEKGHFYANVIEKLPEGLVDLDIIYVDAAEGNDETGNGNETNPVKSLDVAMNINTYLGGGKTIILKEGTYNISTYTIKNDVTVIGEDPSKVTISQPSGNKGMFIINEGLNVEFNNITFANAYTTVMPYGAVFSNYYVSTLVLNNSVFHDNKGWYGGVINNNDQGTVIIDNCDFHNNSGYYAGVLSASEGHVFIYNSNFTDNKAQFNYTDKSINGSGGALILYSASADDEDISLEAHISNCNFINNSAPGDDKSDIGGGAIAISAIGTVSISNSSFIDNHAGRSGGAIWAVHGNIDIAGCEFINNTANAGSAIAAYRNNGTIVNVSNSVILTDDLNTEVIYVSDESESVIYANNNWWGSNSAPNVANTNISSRILLKFYNDEDYNLVVAFVTGDGSIFNDYLPARTLVLAPESEFEQTVFQLGGNANSIVLEYSGEIETAVLNATVDNQTVGFIYKHYPVIDSLVESEDMVAVLGSTITITANVTSNGNPLSVGVVYFYINDNYIGECGVVDGVASITYTPDEKGVFEIGIDYSGDDYYKPYSLNRTLTVTIQIPTSIVASDDSIPVGETYPIRLISSDNNAPVANKDVRIEVILNKIEDYIQTSESIANLTKTTDNNGFVYIDLEEGNYTLNISFLEDSDYMASSNTVNVIVSKSSTSLEIIQNENTGDISIRLTANNNGLADKLVKVLVRSVANQTEYDLRTNEKGYVFISLPAGNYYISASFEEDGTYLPTSLNKQLNVAVDGNGTFIANETDNNGTGNGSDNNGTGNGTIDGNNSSAAKKASAIVYKNMNTYTVNAKLDGKSAKYFTITLKDSDGNLLIGKTVQFIFNGGISKATTDKNGQAKLKIALASKGTYYIVVSFADDASYYSSIVTAKIKVNPQKVKIKVPKKTFKASKKVKKLTATLKNSKGKAIKGKKLTFVVNKKKYTAKTNKKGVATVKVKLSKKKTYKVTVKFAGDKTYKKLSKKGKVKIK